MLAVSAGLAAATSGEVSGMPETTELMVAHLGGSAITRTCADRGAEAIVANGAGFAGLAGLADGQVQRQTVTSIAMGETP